MTVERDLIEVVNDMSSTRSDVVAAYAAAILALKDGPLMVGEPWADVNSTIVERWDKQGLSEIKREAWDIVENKPPREKGETVIPIKFQDISRLLDEIGENSPEGVTAFLDSNGFDPKAQVLIQNLGVPWKVMFATVYATMLMLKDGFGDLAEDEQMDKVTEQMVSAMCAAAFQLGWACHEQYRGRRVKGNVERTL